MKHLKMLGLATFVAMTLMTIADTGTASATILEVTGVTTAESVTITASLKTGTSVELEDTFGFFANTCKESHVHGKTESEMSKKPTGKLTTWSVGGCDHTVTVHNPGKLYVEWTTGTSGRVYSEEADITTYSTIHGTHVTCTTGAGTLLGTLTGTVSGHAQISVNAVLTCGPHLHSAKWTSLYTVTTPTGLGVEP